MLARPVRPHLTVNRTRQLLGIVSVVLVLLIAGSLPTVSASDPKTLTDDLGLRINRPRVAAGLLPLARAPEPDAAAHAHGYVKVTPRIYYHTGVRRSRAQQ